MSDTGSDKPMLLSVAEAARLLGLNPKTLYNQNCRSYPGERIPGRVEFNNHIRYRRDRLVKWLDDLEARKRA